MVTQKRKQKRVHRVYLKFPYGLSRSVFIRAYTRSEAEKRALRQNSDAIGIDHSQFPLS